MFSFSYFVSCVVAVVVVVIICIIIVIRVVVVVALSHIYKQYYQQQYNALIHGGEYLFSGGVNSDRDALKRVCKWVRSIIIIMNIMVIWIDFYCYIISLVNKLFRIFISVFLFVQNSFQLFSSILAYLGAEERQRESVIVIYGYLLVLVSIIFVIV